MNPLLHLLLHGAGEEAVQQLGRQFGLSAERTRSVLHQLVPALMAGLQHNTRQASGMDDLLGALSGGGHARYIDHPSLLKQAATADEGNAILGHIFGSKGVSRAVAQRAADETGLDASTVRQMLPLVATLVMGGLSKESSFRAEPGGTDLNDEVMELLGRFLGSR